MKRPGWKKGIVLMQTLILAIILSAIAMMLLKWVLGRYMSAARTTRSTVARVHSQGYANDLFSNWNMGAVTSSGSRVIDSGNTRQALSYCHPAGPRVVIVSDEDDPNAGPPPCP